jgi:hypothetical protein
MREYAVPIKVGNECQFYSKGIGPYHGKVIKKDGSTLNIILQEVLYVPELYMNLFSLAKMLDNKGIYLRKEKVT